MKYFVLIFILGTFCSSLEGSNVLVWQGLEEFFDFGWQPTFTDGNMGRDFGQGKSFRWPSTLNTGLRDLDVTMTGDGVWSGRTDGYQLSFILYLNKTELCEGMTQLNLTVKYYYYTRFSSTPGRITAIPCAGAVENCLSVGDIPLEWKTLTFPIDTSRGWVRFEITDSKIALIDEVMITHNGRNCPGEPITTEGPTDPESCNESCEFKAIDCHNYYSCVDYKTKKYFTCEKGNGLAFNPVLGVCDRIENVEGCNVQECGCEYRPHSDCSKYIFCPNTCKEELCEKRSCPSGLRWSVEETNGGRVQQCQIPELANCTGRV